MNIFLVILVDDFRLLHPNAIKISIVLEINRVFGLIKRRKTKNRKHKQSSRLSNSKIHEIWNQTSKINMAVYVIQPTGTRGQYIMFKSLQNIVI